MANTQTSPSTQGPIKTPIITSSVQSNSPPLAVWPIGSQEHTQRAPYTAPRASTARSQHTPNLCHRVAIHLSRHHQTLNGGASLRSAALELPRGRRQAASAAWPPASIWQPHPLFLIARVVSSFLRCRASLLSFLRPPMRPAFLPEGRPAAGQALRARSRGLDSRPFQPRVLAGRHERTQERALLQRRPSPSGRPLRGSHLHERTARPSGTSGSW
jgi:hypothetical protein